MRSFSVAALALVACACGTPTVVADAGDHLDAAVDSGVSDAGTSDAGSDGGVDAGLDAGAKAAACASVFGAEFTNAFGRADGRVLAVVPPAWQCPLANSDHVVVQVIIDGGVQRLVVNVRSSFGDPNIRSRTVRAPLPPPAYAEGWHPALQLDYVNDFGLHSDAGWDSLTLEDAAARVYDAITLGQPLSVYATSSGGATAASAHLIHRNGHLDDGAIIVDPTSASPTWMFFCFADQTF